jgi:hypothetical protein
MTTGDYESAEALLDAVCVDLRQVMEVVTGKSAPVVAGVDKESSSASTAAAQPSLISRIFSRSNGSQPAGAAAEDSLRQRHLKSLVVIDQLQEVIDDISRVGPLPGFEVKKHKLVLTDCRNRLLLSDSVRALFPSTPGGPLPGYPALSGECLVKELQLIFANMEISPNRPADVTGVVRALGLSDGGLVSAALPEKLLAVFFDKLKESCKKFSLPG